MPRFPHKYLFAILLGATGLAAASEPAATASAPATTQPASVVLISPRLEVWPERIEMEGNVMPWQEVRVTTDSGGLRLISVEVDVGDMVKKGQVLAVLDTASVEAELEGINAQLMEAQATLTQAEATLARAKRLAASGGVSQQDLTQYETQKQTATARLAVAQAKVKAQQIKLAAAQLVAPADGLISARAADEGDLVRAGAELFRLIRSGRLEWRAEVKGDTLLKIEPGQEALIDSPLGDEVKGRVRRVSPTVDIKTHTGVVYIDLPVDTAFKAGLRVGGTLTLKRRALVLPATAIRRDPDGDRVFTLGSDGTLQAIKVELGRNQDGKCEITSGLSARSRVVASDLAGLSAGAPAREQPPEPRKDATAQSKS